MTLYGNKVNSVFRVYLDYAANYSDAVTYGIGFSAGLNIPNDGYSSTRKFTCTVSSDYQGAVSGSIASKKRVGKNSWGIVGGTYYFPRYNYDYGVNISASLKGEGEGTKSNVSGWFAVPARPQYTVTYKSDNTSSSTNFTTQGGFFYGYGKALITEVPTKENYSFKGWTSTEQGTTVTYLSGQEIAITSDITLYPIWQEMYPPTCNNNGIRDVGKSGSAYSKILKKFSSLQTTASSIDIHTGRTLNTLTLRCVDVNTQAVDTEVYTHSGSAITTKTISVTPTTSGTKNIYLDIKDSSNLETTYIVAERIEVENATWKQRVTYQKATYLTPDIDRFGNAIMTIYAKNTTTNLYEEIPASVPITETSTTWYFDVELGEAYVSSNASATPTTYTKVEYSHTESDEKEYRKAFFNTSRNANFSTGISNTMFVSGSSIANFASRVWWSYVNNPLYFPDTNYVEVGSNDTSVMGLMKVGDYLGAVKQSKTTDTAIYLLYATSFDDDTTFAVKQGVQGIGALGKYSFNILGDETLFLSPNGVMAIVPSEDEEHKVQNRSYFIDGKLLSEEGLVDSYSFVFDGMYWLSTGSHCYVLDGNQKNSWGNDKTNLVYEAYYLENVPANCFMKYDNRLWFSNENNVCRFRNEDDANAFVDSYQYGTTETNVPVVAEWSTILDDDGSLQYYKTMQKKGNVVSILPVDGKPYTHIEVTETEFNADKTKYYIIVNDEYVQCTESSVYSSTETYYIVTVNTSAKVYIKKDTEDIEYVGEINGTVEATGDIPNELHIKKKIKKYKRLQFVVRNDQNQNLGIDSIVKSYCIGNYAKR